MNCIIHNVWRPLINQWHEFKQLKSLPACVAICCPSKRASLEKLGHWMAARATPSLDMCQTPQQTAEVNSCHSLSNSYLTWDFRTRRTLHWHREILILSSFHDGVGKFSWVLHACDVNNFGNVSGNAEIHVNEIPFLHCVLYGYKVNFLMASDLGPN